MTHVLAYGASYIIYDDVGFDISADLVANKDILDVLLMMRLLHKVGAI